MRWKALRFLITIYALLLTAASIAPWMESTGPAAPAAPPPKVSEIAQRLDKSQAWADGRVRLSMDVMDVADLVPPAHRLAVITAARAQGIEPRTLSAVGWVESRWDCTARGEHGEIGCMQILPSTAAWIARQMRLPQYDMTDPETNMRMGAWYLRHLLETEGSLERALAAYNGGPQAYERKPQSARTYVNRVRAAETQTKSN